MCSYLVSQTNRISMVTKANMSKAPVSKDIGLEYHEEQFDAKLFDSNAYRLNASDEVDAAWGELGIACKFTVHLYVMEH